MNGKHIALGACFLASVLLSNAQAVILPPGVFTPLNGTTVAANPQQAGVIIVDEVRPFSFSAYSGTVTGNVQVRIVRSDLDNTLDFYWRVFNSAASAGPVQDLRVGNFYSPEYDADYATDGLGDVGPSRAFRFAPPKADFVNFNFEDGLQPGESSLFFFFDTSAIAYTDTAIYDLTNTGQTLISGSFGTYAPMTADFDGDGDVDGDDFLLWQASFGVNSGGDADFDGDTDGDDFLIWQTQFGSASGSASAAVPEPASVMLLIATLAGAAFFRCRH